MIIKSLNGVNHFISNQKEIAFAWAGYYTRNKECFINNEKYYVEYLFNTVIQFENGEVIAGDIVKFTNLKNNTCAFINMDYANNIRAKNKVIEHYICFDEDQFLKVS
jgi:hypothetical protein